MQAARAAVDTITEDNHPGRSAYKKQRGVVGGGGAHVRLTASRATTFHGMRVAPVRREDHGGLFQAWSSDMKPEFEKIARDVGKRTKPLSVDCSHSWLKVRKIFG
jgi:hypothetical protein